MGATIKLGGISLDVLKKDIKNIHLSVNPPVGKVRISAPLRMTTDTIRVFAISKLAWIRKQQEKFRNQERETPREYLDRESHYVWGKRYLFKLEYKESAPLVHIRHNTLVLQVRPGTTDVKKEEIVSEWYRKQIRDTASELITRWELIIGVKVENLFIQSMKTKWGGSNPTGRNIRLNTELAKKPRECLEYIIVHEMSHLKEPTHNDRFIALLDKLMPKWRHYRDILNKLPVKHERWGY